MRLFLLAFLSLGFPAIAQASPTLYEGACDGSAAAALDAEHFVVANDEDNILRIYRRDGLAAIARFDLNHALKTEPKKDGSPKEADLEGAARVGNRIYWIASHGRDSKGNEELSRQRFFATDIVVESGTPRFALRVAGVYDGLLDDLLEQEPFLSEAAKLAPEREKGLNIEGLAAGPNGQLMIGLRNPRPNDMALLIPLKNPSDVIEKSNKSDKNIKAIFGKVEKLDLGKRGVRSMERIGDRYLIVAGPHGDTGTGLEGGDFALYTWPEQDGSTRKLDTKGSLDGLRPEAFFATTNAKEIYVLSDDGTSACKALKAEARKFRGLAIPVPD